MAGGGGSGNVGIGTTAPQSILDVNGNITIDAGAVTSGGPNINFRRASDGWNPAQIQQIYEGTGYNGALLFLTNTGSTTSSLLEKMRITAAGNVGIGTTSPGSALTIVSSTGPQFTISNAGAAYMALIDRGKSIFDTKLYRRNIIAATWVIGARRGRVMC